MLRLEEELAVAKLLARRLWHTLRVRQGARVEELLDGLSVEGKRAIDRVFDAVLTVWDRHKVLIEPCRQLLDPPSDARTWTWPSQPEMYIGCWPDGSKRNLTRDQVLMMGGQDPTPATAADPGDEVPF